MAAKKKEEKTENQSVFDSIIEQEFTEMQDLSKVDDTVDYWIDSGNWALNYTICKKFRGGYPGGRISNLWGLSGTGKSLMPAVASRAKNWEDIDFYQFDRIVLVDSEGGGTGLGLFKFVDAPLDRVRYVNISTLDSYRVSNDDPTKMEAVNDRDVPQKLVTPTYTYVRGLLCYLKRLIYAMKYRGSKEKILIIIDSISNIKPFRTAVEGVSDMGLTGKLLNNLFALDNDIHQIGASVLLASKVYTNLNNQYDPWVMAGGQSVIYNPSLNLKLTEMSESEEMSEADKKEERERRKTSLGNSLKVIRATVSKSRFGTEGRNCWFVLDAAYGPVRNSGLFKLLSDFKVIEKDGTRYRLPALWGDETFFKKDFATRFAEHEQEYIDKLQPVMDAVEAEMRKKRMSMNVSDITEFEEDDEMEGVAAAVKENNSSSEEVLQDMITEAE